MRKRGLILILIFTLLALVIIIIPIMKKNNSYQVEYIKNNIIEPLTQFQLNIKSINTQLKDMITTKEIKSNDLNVFETKVIQTSMALNDFQNNYNEFIKDEEELILDATIIESRLIQVQNNLHILNEKLLDKDNNQSDVYKITQEQELELLESSQIITSYYNRVMDILGSSLNQIIIDKKDFKRNKTWLEFIEKLGSDVI